MEIDRREVLRYLYMGGRAPDDALASRIDELRAKAAREIHARRVWRRFPMEELARLLPLRGTVERHLEGCHAAFLACGTLGAQFDAFQRRQAAASGAAGLIVQAIGAAAIEQWMDATEDVLRNELASGETLVPRYSPGYGDFPLAAQQPLLALLDAPLKAGVSLTAASLMVPTKSVSAIIGVKRHAPRRQR